MELYETRMHSSRMRTGRSLTVCCSLLPGGDVCLVLGGVLPAVGVCLVQGGSPWSRGIFLKSGGILLGPGGVSTWSGGFSRDPPVDRITDTCKNITLATTSLRPVKIDLPVMFPSPSLSSNENASLNSAID